jgi:uncharacterized cupredoxin-like copper-binding protein
MPTPDSKKGLPHMTKIRLLTLGLAAAAVALVLALPAMARPSATSVTVTAGKPTEFSFKLSTKTVKHGAVTFNVTNGGSLPHDFSISGKKTKLLSPGQSAKLSVTFAKAGSVPYQCTVSGHAAAGMKGTLKVT